MLDLVWPWMQLASRIGFAVTLAVLSAGHFTATDAVTAYAASKRVPAPRVFVLVTGAMVWLGAALIALGWHRFIGAWLVIVFLLVVGFKIHDYWNAADPNARAMDRIQFWKNMALAAGALFFATYSRFDWPMALGG